MQNTANNILLYSFKLQEFNVKSMQWNSKASEFVQSSLNKLSCF